MLKHKAKDVEREKSKKKTDIFDFAAAPSTMLDASENVMYVYIYIYP